MESKGKVTIKLSSQQTGGLVIYFSYLFDDPRPPRASYGMRTPSRRYFLICGGDKSLLGPADITSVSDSLP